MGAKVGNKNSYLHGKSNTRVWNAWRQMRRRCTEMAWFKYYGSRGIKVCERWMDFANFLSDMGEPPNDGQLWTIDRIDGSKGYEPENCRWATMKEQCRNRRVVSRHLTFNCKTQTIIAWSEELGVSYAALRARLGNGWSVERTLSEPIHAEMRRR